MEVLFILLCIVGAFVFLAARTRRAFKGSCGCSGSCAGCPSATKAGACSAPQAVSPQAAVKQGPAVRRS